MKMFNWTYILQFSIVLFSVIAEGQKGSLEFDIIMKSSILSSTQSYSIYLPWDYDKSKEDYPVIYLLHVVSEEAEDRKYVELALHDIFDQADKESADPMIVVSLYLDEKIGNYFNDISEEWQYEDFFFEEFIPYIEKKYRVEAEKEYRAVAGRSGGGSAAYMYALHRPDMFATVCPVNGDIGPLDYLAYKKEIQKIEKDPSDHTVQAYYEQHNALSLINNNLVDEFAHLRWYVECDNIDSIFRGNQLFAEALTAKRIPHLFVPHESVTTTSFWTESLPSLMLFIVEGLEGEIK